MSEALARARTNATCPMRWATAGRTRCGCAAVKNWPIAPCVVDGDPYKPLHRLLEADIVYVRDFSRPDAMSDEQLKHLALVAHHCYGSIDRVMRCLMLLTRRGSLAQGAGQRYTQLPARAGVPR